MEFEWTEVVPQPVLLLKTTCPSTFFAWASAGSVR